MTAPSMLLNIGAGLTTRNIDAYSDEGALRKAAFHKEGKQFLKSLAKALALRPGSFDIRSNLGGIAVSGEVTLHHERLYVQLSESAIQPGVSILYRSCQGRKDYSGGQNHFCAIGSLTSSDGQTKFWAHCTRILSAPVAQASVGASL
jgi:hypothetical protein